MKWDDRKDTATLSENNSNSRFVHFVHDQWALDNILSSSELTIGIDFFGSGTVYYRFDLTGANTAITKAKQRCS